MKHLKYLNIDGDIDGYLLTYFIDLSTRNLHTIILSSLSNFYGVSGESWPDDLIRMKAFKRELRADTFRQENLKVIYLRC